MNNDTESRVVGIVTSVTEFGCEVELEDGCAAFVHISEIADEFVRDARQYLKVGQTIKAYVIGTDAKGRTMLSLKGSPSKSTRTNEVPLGRRRTSDARSFESMMTKFRSDTASDGKNGKNEKNNGRKTSKRR